MASDSCELSPQARAFSTVLTAFVGSIVNGASNGFLVAFMTAWISWFATLRILSGASLSLYQAFSSKYTQIPTGPPTDETIALEERGLMGETTYQGAGQSEPSQPSSKGGKWAVMNKRLNRDVTVLGWLGWVYTAIYSPTVHALWLVENWTNASGPLKLVRGFGISVAALGLTIDTKKRYASRLRDSKYLGTPACVAFKIINAGSAFGMGLVSAALLIKAVIDMELQWFFIVGYCVFSVIWAVASFSICPVQDGGIRGMGIIQDLLMGAFAGVFLAAPAFAVMKNAEFPVLDGHGFKTPESGSASLQNYLSCGSVAVWQKMVAILP